MKLVGGVKDYEHSTGTNPMNGRLNTKKIKNPNEEFELILNFTEKSVSYTVWLSYDIILIWNKITK